MTEFILNNALIITAILSLCGVSLAAILNYRCNIKVNKAKIEYEERKMRQSFLTDLFKILRDAAKELREMEFRSNGENAFDLMAEYNNRTKDIFDSIKPFIPKGKKDALEKQYADIQAKMYALNIKSKTNKLSNDDIENAKNIIMKETHLHLELSSIIDIEISTIADKLKNFEL